ncbi:uncharacterized protein [Oscarella lobularis]|uniref:uncharacterized protein n=1 Tax=Oscarella lobularis TaxID=121494 RepID=UPI00331323C8
MGASQSQAILRHIDRRFDLLESDIKLLIEERNGHTRPRESRTNEKRFKAFFENALFDTNVVTRPTFETHGLFDIQPPVIFVREDFKLFHQIIKEIRSSASKDTIGMIIKGNPGIGKSVFFLYEILWLIREKKNFAYCNPMKELMVYVNFQDQEGEQLRFFKTFDLLKEKIDRRKTVLLFDNTSRSIPAIEFSGFDCIVFCSSPGMSYTILERQLGSRISSRVMSAWVPEELKQMKEACSLEVDVLKEYQEIGGLPRLLLDTKGYCDTKKRIRAAIKRSIPLMDQLFDYISLPVDSMMMRGAPHELIHAFHIDKTCIDYEFRWATKKIESEYVKEKSKIRPEKMKKFLKSVEEDTSPIRRIVGEFYEGFVHHHIIEGLLINATAKLLETESTSSSRSSLDTTASSDE